MRKYLSKIEEKYILMQIFVIGGIFGFLYEEIFYWFDLGYLTKRGTTYGPWIPIYAFGSIFITLLCSKYKKNPLIVFMLGSIISGLLEFATGYILFHIFDTRLWDYNIEILNFGNIGGYICLRSILFFGVSSLLLIYGIIPLLKKSKEKINKTLTNKITTILFLMFIIDIIISCILRRI